MKHLCWSPFFNKVSGLRPATFLKKILDHPMKWQHHYNKCEKNRPSVKYELKDGRYLCNKCDRSFTKQSNASCHVWEPCKQNEASAKSYLFYCKVCEKLFSYKCRLNKHVCNPQQTVPSTVEEAFHNYPDEVIFRISFGGVHCTDKFLIGLFTIFKTFTVRYDLRHETWFGKISHFRPRYVFPILFHYKMYPEIGLKHLF